MKRFFAYAAFVTIGALTLASCGGGSSGTSSNTAPVPGTPATSAPAPGNPELISLGNGPYHQLDRLNRPAVNEVFATFAEHQANNTNTPNDDAALLGPQIMSFMTNVGGRSTAIATVERSVLTPDVQIVDLSGTSESCIGKAPGTCNNYLGSRRGA